MTIDELIMELGKRGVQLHKIGGDLDIQGAPEALDDSLINALRVHKEALLDLIPSNSDEWWSPPPMILPEMLPLVKLSQAEIDRIVETVPGGAVNVQDIYPLAPLQEGILFHHLISSDGDAYVLSSLFAFDTRGRLECFLNALQKVIDRHDILRTSIVWENLSEAVQVVWRRAPLIKEEVELDAQAGDAAEQLYQRFNLRNTRVDVRQAPMLRAYIAYDAIPDCWLLLVLFHHLMGDHTTMDVIQQEVRAHLSGQADRLPKPLPFRNFVALTRLGASQEEHKTFFKSMLKDVDEPTMPFGLCDVQGDGMGIEEAHLEVDADLVRRMRECVRRLKVSAASIFHLAWAQVLARVSGRDDVVFGTVLFGRMQSGAGASRMLGLFINTLPIRIQIGAEGVEASVRHMHALLADLMRHENASLALAQRCSGVPAPMPLFSALLNYRHSPAAIQVSSVEARGALIGIERLRGEERTNYPFMLSVDDLGKGFSLTAQIQTPIEPMRVCEYMHTALERLAVALEKAPRTAVRDLDIMTETGRKQVVEGFNRTQMEYPQDKTIQQLFAEQAMRTPEAMALLFEDRSLTYAELNSRANQLAYHLQSLGVGPEMLVGICVERSLEMVIGLLGILKAGGAYVPMDPGYPPERLAFMLEDAGIKVLLTQSTLSSSFFIHHSPFTIINLDADWRVITELPSHNPKTEVHPGSLAYVIYTSGSTGMPKGVGVEHGNFTPFLWAMSHKPGLDEEDCLLALTTISFDIAALELYLPLMVGAQIVLATEEDSHDALRLSALLAQHRPTVVQATPATWRMLLAGGWRGDGILKLLCGGEAMSDDLCRDLIACSEELWNVYGPTEATVWATLLQITPAAASSPIAGRFTPIGRPLANTRIYILDRNDEPTPIGVAGELHIGGVQVARGYLNRPELTAEKFVPDPFSADPDARLYKTGDLARYLPDGKIEYLGRMDFQVKIRGFRIELGEIETTLARHAQVREAIVLAREDNPGDKRLVAYWVPVDGNTPPDITELRTHLKAGLPEYMLPAAFVKLDSLPLTPNGKVDRKALPAPEYQAAVESYVTPRTPTEQALAKIFSEVLGIERIGVHDDFFRLGGHSLLATQIISRIQKAFQIVVPLRRLFSTPTLAQFAQVIDKELTAKYPTTIAATTLEDFEEERL